MIPRELLEKIPPLMRPNCTSLGIGAFLAANACVVIGGAFPFLPNELQTPENMFIYYLTQTLTFSMMLLLSSVAAYLSRGALTKVLGISSVSYSLGCGLTIATMYFDGLVVQLFFASGFFLGLGSAGFYSMWQTVLSSRSGEVSGRDLLVGTLLGAIIYFVLFLVPLAVTQLLILVVMLPLFMLCLVLEIRRCSFEQPMFTDAPTEHREVYARACRDYWRSAVCIGSVGLASGVIRSFAVSSAAVGSMVNTAAIAGSFISAAILLLLWSRKALRFSVTAIFRTLFPFLVAGFALLPVMGIAYVYILSIILYMAYSFTNTLMLIQCSQASRDRGVHPAFVFGGFAALVYLMHDVGFVTAYAADAIALSGVDPLWAIALAGVTLLAIAYFVGHGGYSTALSQLRASSEKVELIPYVEESREGARRPDGLAEEGEGYLLDDSDGVAKTIFVADPLSVQCTVIQHDYRLTDRETEVMEWMVRGRSMRSIAEILVVSENTIRTHAKRIYVKTGVHKRSQLQELVGSVDLSGRSF